MPEKPIETQDELTEDIKEEETEGSFDDVVKELETEKEKEEPETEKTEAKETEEEEKKKEIEEKEPEEEDEDEFEARGKKLIEEEEERRQKEKEQKAKAEELAEQQRLEAAAAHAPLLDEEKAGYFSGLITKRLPSKIKVGDSEIDLKEYQEDNPEVGLIAGLMAEEYLVHAVRRNAILTTEETDERIAKSAETIAHQLYGMGVAIELQNLGLTGINIQDWANSKETEEWGEKQTEETRALFLSDNPRDYALGIQKFFKDQDMKKAKEKVTKIDEKADKEKKEHIKLHSTTMRSTTKTPIEKTSDEDDRSDATFREILSGIEKEQQVR